MGIRDVLSNDVGNYFNQFTSLREKCYNCQDLDHIPSDCPKKKSDVQKKGSDLKIKNDVHSK